MGWLHIRHAKRSTPIKPTGAARKRAEQLSIIRSSLYRPEPVYESLRYRCVVRRRDYPPVKTLKAGKKRERWRQMGSAAHQRRLCTQ
jgi:hypothetical protein